MTPVLCNSSPISQKGGVAVLCPVAVLGTFPYAYWFEFGILFNSQTSQLMIFDTMKLGYDGNIILGEAPLTVTIPYKYLGHIIIDNLCDEADLEDKERGLYRRYHVLRRTFHFCSDEVKNKLFTCYCSNVYLC